MFKTYIKIWKKNMGESYKEFDEIVNKLLDKSVEIT